MIREFLNRMRRPEPLIGTWLSIGSPVIAELAALSGFDWVLFDLEHGLTSDAALLSNLQAIRGTASVPVVRVGAPHPDVILRALDWGGAGIMVPHVESAAQAEECLQSIHHAPRGRRGFSRSVRANNYGLGLATETIEPLFFPQIESLRGLEHIDEIAAVDGVDVLFVGPSDLSNDLARNGNGHTPIFEECLASVVTAARSAGKQAGILVRNIDDFPRMRDLGFTLIAVDSDVAILRDRYQTLIARTRYSVRPAAMIAPNGTK